MANTNDNDDPSTQDVTMEDELWECVTEIDSSYGKDISVGLLDMPTEVFQKIVSFLDPVWMWNLSHACHHTWKSLSFHNGANHLWYESMPPAIWGEAEAYQDESELTKIVRGINRSIDIANLTRAVPVPRLSLRRKKVKVLGAPFEPIFNYKREIIERMKEDRCQICLRLPARAFNIQVHKYWGVKFCNRCLNEYTLSTRDVGSILGLDGEIVFWMSSLRAPHNDGTIYYVPALDFRLMTLSFPGVNFIDRSLQRSRLHSRVPLLKTSKLEHERRGLRQLIVRVAEALWEGDDVAQLLRNMGRYEPSHYYTNKAQFRFFRERWAPSSKLSTYLFPIDLLTETWDPSIDEGSWLHDPAPELLPTVDDKLDEIPNCSIVFAARTLVHRLAACEMAKYPDGRIGVRVETWRADAWDYHEARLQAELDSGAVLRMDHVNWTYHHDPKFLPMRRLRQKLRLENYFTQELFEAPCRDAVWNRHPPFGTNPAREDRRLSQQVALYKARVGTFNKVMRSNCNVCPFSDGTYDPPGILGLLAHVERNHTKQFYGTDFHLVA